MTIKILILDIETIPLMSYHWRCFKENISAKQIIEGCRIASVGAKWLGDKKHFYEDTSKQSEKKMLQKVNNLLDQADMVVGHNVTGFDMKKIRGRSVVHQIPLPSPYKEVDTLFIARKEFGFESNTLEYLATVLKLTNRKSSHKLYPGFELWLGVLHKEKAAWQEMKEYCIQDVDTTEELYLRVRPYARQHPNVAIFLDNEDPTCGKCGSSNLQRRGKSRTNTQEYQRYQCQDCGGWARGRNTIRDKSLRKGVLAHAVG